jgi:hypothetical protein
MQLDQQPAMSREIAPAILEALGLKGRLVVSLRLDLVSDEVATVTVTELVTRQQGLATAELLKRCCRLVPIDDAVQQAQIKLDGTALDLDASAPGTSPSREG